MFLSRLIRKFFGFGPSKPTRKIGGRSVKMRLEPLEYRVAPASFAQFIDPHSAAGYFGASFSGENNGKIQLGALSQITQSPVTTHFQVIAPQTSNLGSPTPFTIEALDQNNRPTGSGYSGTVHFSSTDGLAILPKDKTLTDGIGIFFAIFNTGGVQTLSVNDTFSFGMLGNSGPINILPATTQFAVSVPSGVTAGVPFFAKVTAEDAGGQTIPWYNGTVQITSTDGQAVLPPGATLTNGVGYFMVTLKTVLGGPWVIKAQDSSSSSVSGASSPIPVNPGAVRYFTVTDSDPSFATGTATTVTVKAFDAFGNLATAYNGLVHFSSSDAQASLPANSPLTGGVGTFNIIFNTAGNQTIAVADTVAAKPTVTGSIGPLAVVGMEVTSFTPLANGFTVTFSKPFVPEDLTLFGPSLYTVQDVTLIGAHLGVISGSLILDPSNTLFTFHVNANDLSLQNGPYSYVFPDDTYTVRLVSGSAGNGFEDTQGEPLDGTGPGSHTDYTTSFTTHYIANNTPVLGIPDFARGPDANSAIKVPNDTGHGIPISLTNANQVQNVMFTLSYNPSLFTVLGGTHGDATDPGASFTMESGPTLIDSTHATAIFHYIGGGPLSGTIILGDIDAIVPNNVGIIYKAPDLLRISSVTVNGAVFTGVTADGLHVNAYSGDLNGDRRIDDSDVALALHFAQGLDTGLAAYPLINPSIIGDVVGDYSIDAGDVTALSYFVANIPVAAIPEPPLSQDFFPSTTTGIHVFEDQLPGGMSNAVVRFLATHTDGTQKQTSSEIAQLRVINPNYTLLHYQLGTGNSTYDYIINNQWSSDWSYVNQQESWFVHQSYSGEPQSAADLASGRVGNSTDWEQADIANPAWQQYTLSQVFQNMAATGSNAWFADSFTYGIGGAGYDNPIPTRYQGTNAANPADWPGGITWTTQLGNWAQIIETAFAQHNAAFGTDYQFIPNLDARATSWEPNWYDNANGVPIVDGAFLEGFGEYTDTYDWTLSMNRGLNLTTNNKIVIMQPYLQDTPDSVTGQQERNFYLGTYLLLKGNETYLNMEYGGGAQYFPEYQLNLGAATTPLPSNVSSYLWNGVYRRDFQNGFVLVNPGSTTYILNLGGNYQKVQGHGGGTFSDAQLDANGNYIGGSLTYQNVSSITLTGGSAAIFLNPTTPLAATGIMVNGNYVPISGAGQSGNSLSAGAVSPLANFGPNISVSTIPVSSSGQNNNPLVQPSNQVSEVTTPVTQPAMANASTWVFGLNAYPAQRHDDLGMDISDAVLDMVFADLSGYKKV